MKFRRAYRGHGIHIYVIRPPRRYMLDGLLEYDRGLHAEFKEGFFDSDEIARKKQWSDEERDLVERYLMRHEDFGHGLYLDAAEPSPVVAEQPAEAEAEPVTSETMCIAWETDGDQAEMCGKPTVDGEFCAKHISLAMAEGA